MLGRTLGGATVAIIQGFIILAICLIAGFHIENPALFPIALLFMFLCAVMFTALGTAIGSVLEDMQAFPLIMNFIVMPLFFFSGALFPLHGLPKALKIAIRLDPLTYGVDGLRGALGEVSRFGIGMDLLILGILTVILLAIGSYLFSRIQL